MIRSQGVDSFPLFNILISFFGLWVLRSRLRFNRSKRSSSLSYYPFVSIIIPCRNEEARLSRTLETLLAVDYPHKEIIVVNDHSEDRTVDVARRYPVRVVEAPPKKENWSGKNGACWAGAQAAKGDYFLFTDADTYHTSGSVKKGIEFLQASDADLISAPPFHLCHNFFEKGLGLFWVLPLIASAFQSTPQPQRLFAIGQYLLFKKESYLSSGGHEAIASELMDDIALAQKILSDGRKFAIYPGTDLYSVQMYTGFFDFVQGWVRLIRLGLGQGTLRAFFEVGSVCHLFAAALFDPHPLLLIPFVIGLFILMKTQKLFAQVYGWTALLAPLSVFLFTALTFFAVAQSLLRRSVVWRGRRY